MLVDRNVSVQGGIYAAVTNGEVQSFHFFTYPPSGYDDTTFVKVADYLVQYHVPEEWDHRGAALETLHEEIRQASAAYQKRVTELQGQINRLLALTSDVRVEGVEVFDAPKGGR